MPSLRLKLKHWLGKIKGDYGYFWHRTDGFAWTLPSGLATHPMAWLIQVNGFIADARQLPREIQEEAFRRGMIPYLP